MILKIKNKKNLVKGIIEKSKKAISVVIAQYDGVKSNKINELRKLCIKKNIYIKVVKNTLMKRIIKKTTFKCLKNIFVGQNIIAFSNENPGDAARLFKTFSKENNSFKIKHAAFEGKKIASSQINILSDIPTYLESISMLIFIIKESCILKLMKLLKTLCYNKKTQI
ncbi:MAG: 50S ribosomal protein L10 [Candidatus Makana argininalis]